MVEHPAVNGRGERSKRPFAGGIADGSQRSYAAPEMVRIHFAEAFLLFEHSIKIRDNGLKILLLFL
jgi:hypothetical protein